MELDPARCYRALGARDSRFDGRFFVGVRTTGIYCRPICPARTPLRRNVDFYPSAAAAAEAGFRPCRRCRPEASPGTPAWAGTSATVTRALRLVGDGALDDAAVDELAGRLGIGERHLRRLFRQHIGASPVAVAQTRRLHFAKKLIDETDLPMTEVAISAGYGSIRRFNAALRETYDASPTELRKAAGKRRRAQDASSASVLWLRLPYRAPLAIGPLLDFLAFRAIPGVEAIEGSVYRRTVRDGERAFRLEVHTDRDPEALWLKVPAEASPALTRTIAWVRSIFDLDADPAAIEAVLCGDPMLKKILRRTPGLRVPGAADGCELAVRAVLGQQVSVRGATTLAGRLVERFGDPLEGDDDEPLSHVFPSADALAEADIAAIGMPEKRADAIRAVCRAIAKGELALVPGTPPDEAIERLLALPGIGPWTAHYVAMRALREPDAFPAGDLVLRRVAAEGDEPLRESRLLERAERWRPWRAYAAIALWRAASG